MTKQEEVILIDNLCDDNIAHERFNCTSFSGQALRIS